MPSFKDAPKFKGKLVALEQAQEILYGVDLEQIYKQVRLGRIQLKKHSLNGRKLLVSLKEVEALKTKLEAYEQIKANGKITKKLRLKL